MQELRRKKFLTEKKYQFKYTAFIILAMLLMALVISVTAYWDFAQVTSDKYIINSIQIEKYIVRIGFLLVIAFLVGIFLSHKIIGPVRRLENMMVKINKGEFNVKINLRSGDDFSKFAKELNHLAAKLKILAEKHPEIVQEMQDKIE